MTMTVGLCNIQLRLPENHSLKGKRQVLKSLITRLHNKFNIAAAEVEDNDRWQIATIGVSCVANDERHANQIINSVIAFIEAERLDAEILNYQTEVLRGPGT